MKRARIIYNPTAGREQIKKELPTVLEMLEVAGYETSAHATTGEGDAKKAAEIAVERQYDLVVVAGGDGTINEVVKWIAEQDYRQTVVVIPTGTTNDFARALQIPRDIKKAAEILAEGQSMKLDIGKVNDEYFMNIAGGGKLTELTYDVPIKLKTVLGHLAYYVKGIEMLPSLKPVRTILEFEDEVIDEEIMLFLIANTNSVGGFEKLAPDARINDAYFDVLILKQRNLPEYIGIATAALHGNHLENEHVIYRQAQKIKVTPEDKMLLNVDGEYGGELPGELINLHQHINFIVPQTYLE